MAHLPELAHENEVPYILISSQEDIGHAAGLEAGTAAAAITDAGEAISSVKEIISKAGSGSHQNRSSENTERDIELLSQLDEYFAGELARAGYGGMDVTKTPMGTQIILKAENPGMIIGKDRKKIRKLTTQIEEKFDLDDPQIDVQDVDEPNLNAQIVADQLANALERGWYFQKAGHTTIDRIMDAGALGAEIVLSGKVTGARSRVEEFERGCFDQDIKHTKKVVDEGQSVAVMKLGTIGVRVKIVPPNAEVIDSLTPCDIDEHDHELVDENGLIGDQLQATPHTLYQLPKGDVEAYFYYFTDETYADEDSKFRTLDNCLTTLGRYRKGLEVIVIDRDRIASSAWDALVKGLQIDKYPALVVAEGALGVRDVGYETANFSPNATNYAKLENGLIADRLLQDSDELRAFLTELFDASRENSVRSNMKKEKIIEFLTIGKDEVKSILSVQV